LTEKAPLPDYSEAVCNTNFGKSEGIYIDISLVNYEKDGPKYTRFATGKTLGGTGDDFIRMSRIAGECSLMLNGRGYEVFRETQTELNLTKAESELVKLALQQMRTNMQSFNAPCDKVDGILNRFPAERQSCDEDTDEQEDAL
jgi:hypothetical protein